MSKMIALEMVLSDDNNLSGHILKDFGRFMPNLIHFTITNNSFNGTSPDGLCQGGSLQHLFVAGSKLEGAIPSSFVRYTILLYTQFTSILKGFGSNSSLQQLRNKCNQIARHLPISLGINIQLTELDLNKNMLTDDISILEFFQLAQNLSHLILDKNNFQGEIPTAMAMCNSCSGWT